MEKSLHAKVNQGNEFWSDFFGSPFDPAARGIDEKIISFLYFDIEIVKSTELLFH